ncbi:hypothetical protein P153DRAFT_435768 [Dothidotthia symphoricarpi CBS 119687]|uniref:Uncharacterized protein n=1 Tax=Dothidotthia symphoricarpi CBS 119687 TaxID=1392245 RepID=A0A6A5ZY41_9PLEO|nr:uncharacterized protein P153DRAFT_435768 [Dothidotthia symphoricarpi CBS 119687]KAF2123697.1 hypothetical protein P153DRAFT_435768 [Dothidotthia symphoricarpi CBS 119687]
MSLSTPPRPPTTPSPSPSPIRSRPSSTPSFRDAVRAARNQPMPTGKYKGTCLKDVPYQYMTWLQTNRARLARFPQLQGALEVVARQAVLGMRTPTPATGMRTPPTTGRAGRYIGKTRDGASDASYTPSRQSGASSTESSSASGQSSSASGVTSSSAGTTGSGDSVASEPSSSGGPSSLAGSNIDVHIPSVPSSSIPPSSPDLYANPTPPPREHSPHTHHYTPPAEDFFTPAPHLDHVDDDDDIQRQLRAEQYSSSPEAGRGRVTLRVAMDSVRVSPTRLVPPSSKVSPSSSHASILSTSHGPRAASGASASNKTALVSNAGLSFDVARSSDKLVANHTNGTDENTRLPDAPRPQNALHTPSASPPSLRNTAQTPLPSTERPNDIHEEHHPTSSRRKKRRNPSYSSSSSDDDEVPSRNQNHKRRRTHSPVYEPKLNLQQLFWQMSQEQDTKLRSACNDSKMYMQGPLLENIRKQVATDLSSVVDNLRQDQSQLHAHISGAARQLENALLKEVRTGITQNAARFAEVERRIGEVTRSGGELAKSAHDVVVKVVDSVGNNPNNTLQRATSLGDSRLDGVEKRQDVSLEMPKATTDPLVVSTHVASLLADSLKYAAQQNNASAILASLQKIQYRQELRRKSSELLRLQSRVYGCAGSTPSFAQVLASVSSHMPTNRASNVIDEPTTDDNEFENTKHTDHLIRLVEQQRRAHEVMALAKHYRFDGTTRRHSLPKGTGHDGSPNHPTFTSILADVSMQHRILASQKAVHDVLKYAEQQAVASKLLTSIHRSQCQAEIRQLHIMTNINDIPPTVPTFTSIFDSLTPRHGSLASRACQNALHSSMLAEQCGVVGRLLGAVQQVRCAAEPRPQIAMSTSHQPMPNFGCILGKVGDEYSRARQTINSTRLAEQAQQAYSIMMTAHRYCHVRNCPSQPVPIATSPFPTFATVLKDFTRTVPKYAKLADVADRAAMQLTNANRLSTQHRDATYVLVAAQRCMDKPHFRTHDVHLPATLPPIPTFAATLERTTLTNGTARAVLEHKTLVNATAQVSAHLTNTTRLSAQLQSATHTLAMVQKFQFRAEKPSIPTNTTMPDPDVHPILSAIPGTKLNLAVWSLHDQSTIFDRDRRIQTLETAALRLQDAGLLARREGRRLRGVVGELQDAGVVGAMRSLEL